MLRIQIIGYSVQQKNKIMIRSRYLTPKHKAELPANKKPGQARSKMRGVKTVFVGAGRQTRNGRSS